MDIGQLAIGAGRFAVISDVKVNSEFGRLGSFKMRIDLLVDAVPEKEIHCECGENNGNSQQSAQRLAGGYSCGGYPD